MRVAIRWPMLTGLALMLLLPPNARAQAAPAQQGLPTSDTYLIELMVGYWRPRADVLVSSDAAGIAGTRIDLRRDLGLSDQGFPALQLVWRPGVRHKLRVQYIPIRVESTAILQRDLLFNGVTYRAGQPSTANLDWTTYRFGYEYDFIVNPRGSAGFIVEVRHTVVRAQLRSLADEVSRQAMPIPAAGGIVRLYPSAHVSLTGEVTFFGVPDRPDGHYGGHVADVDVSAVWHVTRHLGAQIGFRDIDIHHLGEWNTATFTMKGVYVGALVRY